MMRCKGGFIDDRVCDICQISNPDMYYECKAMYEDEYQSVGNEEVLVTEKLFEYKEEN